MTTIYLMIFIFYCLLFRSGTRWAHVSCAIWVPEVGFGDPDKMEPIINISKIPESRWSLVCSMCKLSNGAAIQCSIPSCKTAFHVTCAFENNLEMQELLSEDGSDVSLKAYCRKHTAQLRGDSANKILPDKGKSTQSSREAHRSAMASGLKQSKRPEEVEVNFFALTSGYEPVCERLKVPSAVGEWIFAYWKLKRRSLGNRALLPAVRAYVADKERQPYSMDNPVLTALRRFIVLRQDLERARNLCYMLVRREKQKRSLLRNETTIFEKLPDLDAATSSWKKLLLDPDMLAQIGKSPSACNLNSIFGLRNIYQSVPTISSKDEDAKITEADKNLIKQCRKRFRDAVKTSSTSSPVPPVGPKVNRVSSVGGTKGRPPKTQEITVPSSPPSKTMNPKLNKIRLRLAKSPSARTTAIRIVDDDQIEPSPVAVVPKKRGRKRSEKPNLFDQLKEELNLPSPSPPPKVLKAGLGRCGKKSTTRKPRPVATSAVRGVGGGKTEATISAAKSEPVLPPKHRRIKVPDFMEDEQDKEDDDTSSSSNEEVDEEDQSTSSSGESSDSSSSSDEESSDESTVITAVNPRQMRNRRRAAAQMSENESSSDSSTAASSSSEGEEAGDNDTDDDGANESGSEEEEQEEATTTSGSRPISTDSDFVKTPPPKKPRRGRRR